MTTRVGCISSRCVPPEEQVDEEVQDGEGTKGRVAEEGEEGGPRPPGGEPLNVLP